MEMGKRRSVGREEASPCSLVAAAAAQGKVMATTLWHRMVWKIRPASPTEEVVIIETDAGGRALDVIRRPGRNER